MYVVTTESGTAYEVDSKEKRVRRTGGGNLRRDGEWLFYSSMSRPKVGESLRFMLEPLAELAQVDSETPCMDVCCGTMRVTSPVVSIDRKVVQ